MHLSSVLPVKQGGQANKWNVLHGAGGLLKGLLQARDGMISLTDDLPVQCCSCC